MIFKQREHIARQAEKLLAGSLDLYDLSVVLGLCTRDQEFRCLIQEVRKRFIRLLDLEEPHN